MTDFNVDGKDKNKRRVLRRMWCFGCLIPNNPRVWRRERGLKVIQVATELTAAVIQVEEASAGVVNTGDNVKLTLGRNMSPLKSLQRG